MVSLGDSGRAWSVCCKPSCLLLTFVLLLCGAACVLYWQLSADSSPINGMPQGRHHSAAQPYNDFIDPDLSYLQHMFYSGDLVRAPGGQPAFRRRGRVRNGTQLLPDVNVTVFEGKERQHYNVCVPFHVPGNRTLKICVYEREVDQMISAYIQDHGEWEKEQVADMVHLLGHRHEDGQQAEHISQARAAKTGDNRADSEPSSVHRAMTVAPSGREGAGRDEAGGRVSVIDVGCNVGVYTLTAASLGHRVLAIDPVLSSLHLLDTSLRLAGLKHHVTMLHNAVSDSPGPLTVHINVGNMGGSSVSRRKGSGLHTAGQLPTVWAVCLNHLVPYIHTRRVLLKLDIEGWEARALRCADLFFQQLDVCCVLMEWLFYRTHRGGADIIAFMIRNGLLPYSDVTHTTILSPDSYRSWPDNVWWIKR